MFVFPYDVEIRRTLNVAHRGLLALMSYKFYFRYESDHPVGVKRASGDAAYGGKEMASEWRGGGSLLYTFQGRERNDCNQHQHQQNINQPNLRVNAPKI